MKNFNAFLLWIPFTLSFTCSAVAGHGTQAYAPVPKHVLAFYYGWYGNPQVSGRWLHWKDVDVVKKQIGSSTHYPVLGAYDSHDPQVVEQHCREAREAGLTGFIASWWAINDFHDQGLPLLLDTAHKHGLKVTVYYETVKPRGAPVPAGAVKDVLYLLDRYAKHPAWLTVSNRPVIFVYGRAVNEIKLAGWQDVIAEVNQKFAAGAMFIGDQITAKAAQVFDGIHTYNITGRTKGMSVEELRAWARKSYPEAVQTAGNKISCITVIPGYDDSRLADRPAPRPITDRHDGKTYRVIWEEAVAARPNWILITSWNEWHEGSEIEPSAENGDRELKTTKEYSRIFLK